MQRFLHLRTSKFPILEGEDQELINPGTYGRSFAEYLQRSLSQLGYESASICCEDWGWWVDVKLPSRSIGLCCYRAHDENGPCEFACSASPEADSFWSWKSFRRIDIAGELDLLVSQLADVFINDDEIEFIGQSEQFPL